MFWEIKGISKGDMADNPVISLWDIIQYTKHNGNKGLFEDYMTKSWLQLVNVMIMCKCIYMHTCMDEQQ